jgi:putative acetyltransferase
MTSDIEIRNETSDDIAAIAEVTIAAFRDLEISNQTEHVIIDALRAAEALAVSLVAVLDGGVVGHIAFSPVALSDGTGDWYGLGPVSVLPQVRRRGIGQALVREGVSRLKRMHARGCCLVGHPEYDRRFGFENCPPLVLEGVPPEVFFAVSFDGTLPRGTVAFHEGFGAFGPAPCANAM